MSYILSSPTESDSDKVNVQLATTCNLSAFLRKQKFYMHMIDSLEPAGDLNPKEAKVQSVHLNQFYDKFISNQSEITTLVEDALFDHQVEISQKVEQKVRKIQTKLEEIVSAIKAVQTSASSVINEHFDQTERPQVISEFLDSQFKKQKSLIKQIEFIESRNNVDVAEAEILHSHLSQLHDAFVKNQSKIEAYINGPALDEQLQISGGILQKVITLQTKLKRIFSSGNFFFAMFLLFYLVLICGVQTPSRTPTTSTYHNKADMWGAPLTSSLPKGVLSGDIKARIKSSESVSLIPEDISSCVVEDQAESSESVSSIPQDISSGDVKAQEESSKSATSVPEGVSSDDVEAQGELLGPQSHLNDQLGTFIYIGNKVCKKILQNIDHPPNVAGSIHLRPWVEEDYERFLSSRKYKEQDFREFPYLLRKVKEISEKVERAVKDYRLYCDGKIPRRNLDYISSLIIRT